MDGIIERSRNIDAVYRKQLKDIPGIKLPPPHSNKISYNYPYEPVDIIEDEFGMSRDALYNKLKEYNVHCRRYFYPLICDYACYQNIAVKDPLVVSRQVSERILTLPIYDSLEIDDVEIICEIIRSIQRNAAYKSLHNKLKYNKNES